MSIRSYFSSDFAEARRSFLDACAAAGARVTTFDHPQSGASGESLATDIAWVGPTDASRLLVTISGTHGGEGFCGSGCQVGSLQSGLLGELPDDTAALFIHAINPYGFSWLRRVNEDNVDLNRNFVNHAAPYPTNEGYEALHELLCPGTWDDAVTAEIWGRLAKIGAEQGISVLQEAISAGQYAHPDGLFFGGHAPVWSHTVVLRICDDHLNRARHVALIDYHTGLGAHGHGERICSHRADSPAYARALDWYGGDITSPQLGSSSSPQVSGKLISGLERRLSARSVTAITLEYGTLPLPEVMQALMADNWLHQYGDPRSEKGRRIKSQMRDAFYPDSADWQERVWERAVETQRMALEGMTEIP